MWENEIYINDIKGILESNSINFNKFNDKNILITGATGIIGSMLVNTLLYANKIKKINCNVYAMVRNKEKAEQKFGKQLKEDLNLNIVCNDIKEQINIKQKIDYIIHAASETSSQNFINNPLETIKTTLLGARNVLEFDKKNKSEKTIFLSTMEVYGTPHTDEKIKENHETNLMTDEVRNCYPISKRMAENIFFSYSETYKLNIDVLRLTQTFGPGVNYSDKRVFAEFARCVLEQKNIVLHTKGNTKRNYLYLGDAISAILTVLTSNISNEIYNVANEETYCSIYEMAKLVAEKCSNNSIEVKIEEEDINKYGFAKTLNMNLDTTKIRNLGWEPTTNLEEMYKKLIKTMK